MSSNTNPTNPTKPTNLFECADNICNTNAEDFKKDAQRLYEQISEFYMFLIDSIEPEDYVTMQADLGYTESYDEHIDSLLEGIPQKETTIQYITDFLNTYREFADEEYVGVLKQLNSRIQLNRNLCKQQAYKIMLQQAQQAESLGQREAQIIDGKVEALVGGKLMSFDTYNNPLLVSLFSLLLVWFSLKNYGELPMSVVYPDDDESN